MTRYIVVFVGLVLTLSSVSANKPRLPLELVKVTNNVYAIVGPIGNRSKYNLGNNATFGVVVTSKGVVLIDDGATYEGAAHIHALIKTITKLPIKIVINTGGQDHRWLGNDYFKKQGAKIIANQRAVADQKQRKTDQFFMLGNLLDKQDIKKTHPVYADQTFDTEYSFTLGDVDFKLYHAGQAHTPGDIFVWLPKQQAVFAGDIIYVERMLGIFGYSKSKTWVQAFEAVAALKPKYIIPGHGHPTNLASATKDTYEYLVFLRALLIEYVAAGGGIENVGKLDQNKYSYLNNYEVLKGRNAQQVFQELEFE